MAKKSFILHIDSLCILDDLPDDLAGKLFKAIRYYHTHGEVPELDFALKIALSPFINQFKRDGDKYDNKCEINALNGKLGGRPRKENPNNPDGFSESEQTEVNRSKAKKGDSDNDSDSKNDNESKKETLTRKIELFDFFWTAYGKKTGKENSKKLWLKIPLDQMQEIIQKVKPYVQRTPDIQFRKDPATWLRAKGWEDEMDTPKPDSIDTITDPANATIIYKKSDCPGWHPNAPFNYDNYRRYKTGGSLKDSNKDLIPGSNVIQSTDNNLRAL